MSKFKPGRATSLAAMATAWGALAAPDAAFAYGIQMQSLSSAGGVYSKGSASCGYGSSAGGGCTTHAYGGGQASAGITPLGGGTGAAYVSASESVSGAGASATTTDTVDLSTASISFYGADTAVTNNCSSTYPCGGTSNGGSYTDVLHFTAAGAGPTTTTTISLIFTLKGSLIDQGTATDANASGDINGVLNFGGSDARFDLHSDATTNYQTQAGYFDTYPSNYPGQWTSNAGLTSNVYTETYTLTGPTQDVAVQLGALQNCGDGYACDFSAKLALSVPTGVTYTSDSGVFLTGVPEPATWTLLVIGFGALGAAIRRRGSTVTLHSMMPRSAELG